MFANFSSREFSLISREGQMDVRAMALLAFALLCATSPFELSQITFALVGAVAYALVQATQLSLGKRHCERSGSKAAGGSCGGCRLKYSGTVHHARPPPAPSAWAAAPQPAVPGTTQTEVQVAQAPRVELRQPSSQPIAPLTLAANGWDAEVEELLSMISPTQEGDRVVLHLLRLVKQTLRKLIPEIEVVGFATGDLVRGTAYGVAVPEVEIIVSASTEVLARGLQGRLLQRGAAAAQQQVDPRKLQKSAVRACTDRLVAVGGFKFRRSAFRGQEPKVTLLVPAAVGIHSEAIPIDFSVNATTPLYNAAMLVDCGRLEPRARALILLVKRWSKDRGICHAAKGHLSPYAWTLLIIYFLQVGADEDGVPVLPPFEDFELCSEITRQPSLVKALLAGPSAATALAANAKAAPPHGGGGAGRRPVGVLFQDFVHFYSKVFDWAHEAVSIGSAVRAPPSLLLPLHILSHEDGVTTKLGPSIEDPFDSKRNLGEGTSVAGMARLQEELSRAGELLSRGASLTELLEPWVPPDRSGGSDGHGEEETPGCYGANAGSMQ